jgi:hypothetical protein
MRGNLLMRKTAFILLIGMVLLTACNLPSKPDHLTPTVDAVATQVSVLKTAMPSATTAPTEAPTAAFTATSAPSETPAPATETPTQPPTETAVAERPDWTESFEGGKAFYLYTSPETEVKMENGALVLTGVNANGWLGWSLTYSQKPLNFRLEAVFQTGACAGADLYGLVFRAPNGDSGYFYGVTCDGRYNLYARNFADGTDTQIVALTGSNLIQAGANQTNRLGVQVNGNKIELLSNGEKVWEGEDSTFQDAGYFGAFVAANQTANFTVQMDEINLWKK